MKAIAQWWMALGAGWLMVHLVLAAHGSGGMALAAGVLTTSVVLWWVMDEED